MKMIVLDTLGKLDRHGHGLFGWCSDCGSPARYRDDVRARRTPEPAVFDIDLRALIRERGGSSISRRSRACGGDLHGEENPKSPSRSK